MANVEAYDEKGNKIGEMDRDKAWREGHWLHNVYIIPYTREKEILLELRSKNKAICPRTWAVPSEHPEPGEPFITTARRGLQEELGIIVPQERIIDLDLELIVNLARTERYVVNEFQHYFAVPYACDPKDLKLRKDEVEDALYVPLSQVGIPPFTIPLTESDIKKVRKTMAKKKVFRNNHNHFNDQKENVA